MKIESLSASADRAGKFRVQFDNGRVMRLYRQTVQDLGLYTGMELSEEDYQKLLDAHGSMSAKMRAMRIVSATGVSKGELERRLVQKGEKSQDAQAAVQWLSELTLLDDAKTAEQIVSRCASKGYGLARAKQALFEKRIPKELWADALADYPDQSDAIAAFLASRLDENSDAKDIRRAVDALMRRGHSYAQVRKALDGFHIETEEYSEDTYG